ncbi:RHS repeat-associated core domain-containing protein [Nocardiopsis dassonvillei]|uniref:RHS repeat-associated core domain-containing protein n=1 Tax=Nocardiopsis dassonvillei TaxID=2014 RepID=UPI003F565C25
MHLNHRFHNTFTLGFTQPDPSRQELNNYNYAQCDPINNTDPTGLLTDCQLAWLGFAGSAVGIVVTASGTVVSGGAAVGGVVASGIGIGTSLESADRAC